MRHALQSSSFPHTRLQDVFHAHTPAWRTSLPASLIPNTVHFELPRTSSSYRLSFSLRRLLVSACALTFANSVSAGVDRHTDSPQRSRFPLRSASALQSSNARSFSLIAARRSDPPALSLLPSDFQGMACLAVCAARAPHSQPLFRVCVFSFPSAPCFSISSCVACAPTDSSSVGMESILFALKRRLHRVRSMALSGNSDHYYRWTKSAAEQMANP